MFSQTVRWLGVMTGLALILGLAPVIPAPATAQEAKDVTLTIQKLVCPPGYEGDDFFTDCDEPGEGITFVVEEVGLEETTGSDGAVVFEGLEPGTVTISEDAETAEFTVFCLDVIGNVSTTDDGFVLEEVEAGDVGCTVFNVPTEEQVSEEDTPTEEQDTETQDDQDADEDAAAEEQDSETPAVGGDAGATSNLPNSGVGTMTGATVGHAAAPAVWLLLLGAVGLGVSALRMRQRAL
jgi:hypothetical protein